METKKENIDEVWPDEEVAVTAPMEEEIIVPEHKRSYWEFGLFVAIVITLVAVVGVLAFLLTKTFFVKEDEKASIQTISEKANQNVSEEKKVEDKAEVKKEEEKAPEVKEINPAELVVKVLNGGGVGGSAGKARDALLAKGYKKVEVGNAEKSTYVGVTVFYQGDMKTAAEKVVSDLKAKYPTIQSAPGVSAEEKSSAVVVITGK